MKSIDELGISPAPWDGDHYAHYVASAGEVGSRLCVASDVRSCDLNLIAAAPELYECLHKFVNDVVCRRATKDCVNCNMALCWVKKAKAVLAKAGEAK